MENMDKVLNIPKWVLINRLKIPQNSPRFIRPNCLPKPKTLGFRRKKASLGVRIPWFVCGVAKSRGVQWR